MRHDVCCYLAQLPVLRVSVRPHPGQRLGQARPELDHDHALGLEQLGAALDRAS
jgi:hypothetical protein